MNTNTNSIMLKPIGTIHTRFARQEGTPIQAAVAGGAEGYAEVLPEHVGGLKDLGGFDRVWLLYWLDRAGPARMTVTPYLDDQPRGVFATRAPSRPNPIGLSCVKLVKVLGSKLIFRDADMLDGTPLLDIKPYAPRFDVFEVERSGWLDNAAKDRRAADGRFAAGGESTRQDS